MLEGFDFDSSVVSNQLTGTLRVLREYSGLTVPREFFHDALERLRSRYLNVPLSAVLLPASDVAQYAAAEQTVAANRVAPIADNSLAAQEWFERGVAATIKSAEAIQCYTQAILLEPAFAEAYSNRGMSRESRREALSDLNEAVRVGPTVAFCWGNRAIVRYSLGDTDGARQDFDQALHLKPNYAEAWLDER
jgi:tetratricopeptide (TPR) repeat protein